MDDAGCGATAARSKQDPDEEFVSFHTVIF
jgi:hypothetical protein